MRRLSLACLLVGLLAGTAHGQTIITYTSPLPVGSGGTGSTIGGLVAGSAATIGFASTTAGGGTCDTCLVRDAANTLAQKNGTAIQAFRVYGSAAVYSEITHDATNAIVRASSGDLYLSAGATATVRFQVGNTTQAIVNGTGLQPITDLGLPLGTASLRWSTAYVGTAVRGGSAGALDIGAAAEGIKRLYCDFTNTATVGAVTINKACGRVNIAAAGTSVVVTDSLVTAASHCFAVMSSADATGRVISCVPAAGSFTITSVATTGQASFDFWIVNAD